MKALLHLPNDPRLLTAATEFILHAAAGFGLPPERAGDLQMAAREALGDAWRRSSDPEAPVEVAVEEVTGAVQVRVRDQGMPFSQSGLPRVQSLVDALEVRHLGREGNEVVLTRHRSAPAPAAPAPLQLPEDLDTDRLDVRLVGPGDAESVARVIYETYGYTYAFEEVYLPDHLLELNREKLMFTALAVTPEGEPVGTESMKREVAGSRVWEGGVAAVPPRFRQHGVPERLGAVLWKAIEAEGCDGLVINAVTVHPFSQKMAVRSGFHETGLTLAHSTSAMRFLGVDQAPGQPVSTLQFILDLNPGRPLDLHYPERHAAMLTRISERVGWARVLARPVAEPAAEHTRLSVAPVPYMRQATLTVEEIGRDVVDVVHSYARHFDAEGFHLVLVRLPLAYPSIPLVVPRLESHGFFFSGLDPGVEMSRPMLRLQRLRGVALDYDALVLETDFGREIRDYVRSCDPN